MALSVLHPRVLPADVSLAQLWELDNLVRQRVRENKKLLKWKSPQLTGVASAEAAALNSAVLLNVASWWVPRQEMPCSMPIEVVRKQVMG
jgi:hypothetical protein